MKCYNTYDDGCGKTCYIKKEHCVCYGELSGGTCTVSDDCDIYAMAAAAGYHGTSGGTKGCRGGICHITFDYDCD